MMKTHDLYSRILLAVLLTLAAACAAPERHYWAVSESGEAVGNQISREYIIRAQEDPGSIRIRTADAGRIAGALALTLALQINNGDEPLALDASTYELVTRSGNVYAPADPPDPVTVEPRRGRTLRVTFALPDETEPVPAEFRFRWSYEVAGRTFQHTTAFIASPDPVGDYGSPFIEDRPFGPRRPGDFWAY